MSITEELFNIYKEKPTFSKITVLINVAFFSIPCHLYFFLFERDFFNNTDFLKLQAIGSGLSLTLWILFFIPIFKFYHKKLNTLIVPATSEAFVSIVGLSVGLLLILLTLFPLVVYWVLDKFNHHPSIFIILGLWSLIYFILWAIAED